ncbi:MAG: hypothetical protein B7X04_01125 [Parcubacteria group bacterium 21-54-25]|nr:MAG: hypothetical protein B7X04_01125 [Parcubacteria group bacterium 21-54-25]HQU07835.1 hypothetical protein [Candidatus Paceibacterota bacterium]
MEQKQKFIATPVTSHEGDRKPFIRLATVFVAGIAVGALGTLAWSGAHQQPAIGLPNVSSTSSGSADTNGNGSTNTIGTSAAPPAASSATTSVATYSSSTASSGAVSVGNQPAGNTVLVQSVTVPPPGVWIAVRETDGSNLGNVLGAARVHGPLSNVTVDLLRSTEPGKTYVVELYRPSTSGFSVNDSVYVDFTSGQPVIAPFHTTATTTAATPKNP